MNEQEFTGMNEETIETNLWEYIDGLSPEPARTIIAGLIAENATWKSKYGQLLEMHALLNSAELEQPSMRFTRNVMEEIASLQVNKAARKYIDQKVVWGIMGFFIAMIIGVMVYSAGLVNWTSKGDPGYSVDIPRIDLSPLLSNTSVTLFMMVNVVLGLFFLDRALAARHRKYGEEA